MQVSTQWEVAVSFAIKAWYADHPLPLQMRVVIKRRQLSILNAQNIHAGAAAAAGVARAVVKSGGTGGGGRAILTPVGQKLIQHYHSIEMRTRAAGRREFRALGRLLHG
jgi:hypothetical protein